MKIYLAARLHRREEMRGVANVFEAIGHEITSSWINRNTDNTLSSAYIIGLLNDDKISSVFPQQAQIDFEDLMNSDTLISFSSPGDVGTGARFVEFGIALGRNIKVIVIGSKENIFATLPQIEHYKTLNDLIVSLITKGQK